MTVGSVVRDFTTSFSINRQIVGGGNPTYGTARLGRKTTKTWNGGDDPPARPTYTYFTYPEYVLDRKTGKFTKVRMRRRKERQGATSRVKRADHNYAMELIYEDNQKYTELVQVYVWDPVLQRGRWDNESTLYTCSKEAFGSTFSWTDTWDSNDDIALIGRLRTKIAGSDFNAGVFLAEANQALGMIANSATRIRKSIKALLKGRIYQAVKELGAPYRGRKRGVKEKSKSLADSWLEISYGWMPLLSDAKSGAEMLAKLLNLPLKQTYRARLTKKHKVTQTSLYLLNHKCSSLETGQIKAVIEEVNVIHLSGLTDIPSIVHEKTPWSFVADWFIPIGNYLSARGLAQSLTGTFTTTKTFTQYVSYSGKLAQSSAFYKWIPIEGPEFERLAKTVNRTVSTSLAVPMPKFKPLAEVPSWKRAANAVSLLVQKIF